MVEQQANYRDPSENNFPDDYDDSRIDSRITLRTTAVRQKMHGLDVRGALAQGVEIGGSIADEAKEEAAKATQASKDAQDSVDNLNNRWDENINGQVEPNELIDFRHSDMLGKAFDTSRLRGDFFDKDLKSRGVNIMWFGAIGDGNTDCSAAINQAIAEASSMKGTVIIPAGKYLLSSDLIFKSNIHFKMDTHAILYGPGQLFRFDSISTGYYGGVQNVTITGGSFAGDFENGGAFSGAVHHANHLVFENVTFTMTTGNTHTFDLCGCTNIIIRNCTFEGMNPEAGREYVEAIQVDYSNSDCLTYKSSDQLKLVDGLATKNVIVTACTFKPIYNDDLIEYYAPNPIGEHVSFSNDVPENIQFINNNVLDGVEVNNNSSITGWIHFQSIKNLKIMNNLFQIENHHQAIAIGLFGADINLINGLTGEVEEASFSVQDNILIMNNHFTGFDNKNTTVFGIIQMTGNSVHGSQELRISNNTFDNMTPNDVDWTTADSSGSDLVHISGFTSVFIENNVVNNARRFLYISEPKLESGKYIESSFVVKNNMLKNVMTVPIVITAENTNSSLIDISSNSFVHVRGALSIIMAGGSVVLNGNQIWFNNTSRITNSVYKDVSINVNCKDTSIVGNIVKQSANVAFQYSHAFNVNYQPTFYANNSFNGSLTNITIG